MVKLNRVEITNYRSCLETKVPMLTNLTALIGSNGAGKTSILNAFMLVKKAIHMKFYMDEEHMFDINSIVKMFFTLDDVEFQFKIEVLYEIGQNNIDEVEAYKTYFKTTSSRHWTRFRASDAQYAIAARKEKSDKNTLAKMRAHQFLRGIDVDFREQVLDVLELIRNTSYYSASQFSDPSKCPISFELDESKPFRASRGEAHHKFIIDLYNLYKFNSSLYKRYVSTVDELGIGLVEDIQFFDHKIPTMSYEVKSGGRIAEVERLKYIIVPSFIIDGFPLSPSQLSEGTFKTLALVFYILTDTSNLLLIEEPEVGVHHGLLNSIIELIKQQSKHKQIVISTHSDYILDKLKPENIVLVEKENGKGTKSKALNSSLSKDDYKALKSYLENSGNLGEYWKESGFGNG